MGRGCLWIPVSASVFKWYAGSFRKVGFSAASLLKKALFTLNIATAFVENCFWVHFSPKVSLF